MKRLYKFYADWCGPCKMMDPIVKQFVEKNADQIELASINIDDQEMLARHCKVTSLPTLILLEEDEISQEVLELTRVTGYVTLSTLESKLEGFL